MVFVYVLTVFVYVVGDLLRNCFGSIDNFLLHELRSLSGLMCSLFPPGIFSGIPKNCSTSIPISSTFSVFLKVHCFEKSTVKKQSFSEILEICSPIELVNLSKLCFEFSKTSVMPFIVPNGPKHLQFFHSMTLNLNILWTIPLLISWAFLSILSFKAVNCFKISSSASFHRFQAIKDRQLHLDLHKKPPERHKNRNPCFASNRCVVN